jgi:hypothetical protein
MPRSIAANGASSRFACAVAGGFALAGLAGCALDFDRFDPVAADAAAPHVDASPVEDARSTVETEPEAGDDASGDSPLPDSGSSDPEDARAADGATDAGASCTPPASCLSTAGTCAAACGQTEQQCAARCSTNSCRTTCTRTETTCTTQCSDTCDTCTESAGCRSTSACSSAAKP